jgi:hypothetical protein
MVFAHQPQSNQDGQQKANRRDLDNDEGKFVKQKGQATTRRHTGFNEIINFFNEINGYVDA